MLAQPFIYKNATLKDGENYDFLRKKGREQIEQLASAYWTDYNSHDPGITILEALCYAITDLGYRTQFEVKDLLTRSEKGTNYTVGKFHTAAEILSCYPVTFNDLKKVLMDIRGVRNAWIYPVHDLAYTTNKAGCDPVILTEEEVQGEWESRRASEPITDPDVHFIGGMYEVCVEFEEWVKEMSTGPADLSGIEKSSGIYLPADGQGIMVDIMQDVVLSSVSVYSNDPDPAVEYEPLTIALLNGNGEQIASWEFELTEPHAKTTLDLDYPFTFDPDSCEEDSTKNQYSLIALGSEKCVQLFTHREENYPFVLENIVQLTEGSPNPEGYYFFYDWQWDSPASEDEQGTWNRTTLGEPDDTNFASEYVVPNGEMLVFDVEKNLTLDAIYVFVSQPGDLVISLINDRNQVIETCELHISDKLCKVRIPLCWNIPACQNYRLSVTTQDKMKVCLSHSASFPYSVHGVLHLIGGTRNGKLEQFYPFFYDWEITWRAREDGEIDDHELTKGSVRREIWRKLHANRNLCEEPVAIEEVQTEEIGIDADIILEPGAKINEVHASILCILEAHLKPPVHFYSLSEMMEKKYPVEDIFSGPILEHGFMDPAEFELAINRRELRSSDVMNLLMDIDGVKEIRKVRLQAYRDGVLTEEDPWFLCLVKDKCWKPNFTPGRSCLTFYKRNIIQRSDAREVAILLEEKRLSTRPIKLTEPASDLPVPIGKDREVGDYWPMQHDLPGIFRTGKFEVPGSETIQRRAQSRQLKAFLMFFEQILANYLAQLENMNHLFSWESTPQIRTYFTQPATADIANADLLFQEYSSLTTQLDEIIEGEPEALERRNRFLDHLIGRFAESFSDYSSLMFEMFEGNHEGLKRVIADKEVFLETYPALSAQRARAVNLRETDLQLSGYQHRVMALLGMRPVSTQQEIAADGYQLQQHTDGRWRIVIEAESEMIFISRYEKSRALASGLFDLVLMQGADPKNYVLQEEEQEECVERRWDLSGPCSDGTVLGNIPGGKGQDKELLMEWVTAFTPSPVTPTQLSTSWLDLASDRFHVQETESGWLFQVLDGETILFESERCQRQANAEQILDTAIQLGSDRSNYLFDEKACVWQLINDCGDGSKPAILGATTSAEALRAVIQAFTSANTGEGFHLLEHLLLRPRSDNSPFLLQVPGYTEDTRPPIPEPYSFQATVLLPAWLTRSQNLGFRRLTEETLRREAPAHTYLHIIWLSHTKMRAFEVAYQEWLKALQALSIKENGVPPFSPPDSENLTVYNESLTALIASLDCLGSVYPPARLYDHSQDSEGEAPLLGRMSLKAM